MDQMTQNKTHTQNDTVELIRQCKQFLEEKKAENVVALDLMQVNSYLDYFVIASANSRLHARSLAAELQSFLRTKMMLRHMPEIDTGWVVLDYNEVIFHIFLTEEREYYNLEKLWADAERL